MVWVFADLFLFILGGSTNSGTDHHNILVDSQYKQIGCAFTKNKNPSQWFLGQGQWVCDLKR